MTPPERTTRRPGLAGLDDDRLAQLVVERGLVDDQALARCRAEQRRRAARGDTVVPLMQLLIRGGLLAVDQLVDLLSARAAPRQLGRYPLVREIARGGMGVVYEGRDPDLDRGVAIKVILPAAASPELVERLHREARLAGQLAHPHIITIHEVGQARPSPDEAPVHFIVMDLVEGGTLDEVGDPLELPACVTLLAQVAEAVGHAHAQGVVHRDLKPSNVLVTPDRRAIVTDFGLARGAEEVSDLTGSGAVLGTVSYMAPEQALGKPDQIGPHSDVWALGVMLYELLTATLPFRGHTAAEVYQQILGSDPLPPRQLAPGAPRDLAAVCLRALEKPLERRYADGAALAADLRRWLAGEPTKARPPSPAGRLWRGLRRRPALLGSLGAAVVLLSLMTVGLEWRERRARGQRVDQLRAAAREARTAADAALAQIDRLTSTAAPPLRHPNGEVDRAALASVYDAFGAALDRLDRLARLAGAADGPAAGLDATAIDRRRVATCRGFWTLATRLGDDRLARLAVQRAAAAGLPDGERRAAQATIEAAGRARETAALDAARTLLTEARKPWDAASAGAFEYHLNQLVRLGQPALVRLLLDPTHLDSPAEFERRLTIAALGRIGDPRTVGPDGQDAVEALCARLDRVDPRGQLELAVAIVGALGYLRDPRAHAVIARVRARVGSGDPLWQQTQVAFERIPLPAGPTPDAERPTTVAGWLARVRARKGKVSAEALLADVEQALRLDANSVPALVLRATLNADRDRTAARRDLDRALILDPRSATAHARRSRLRLRDDPAGALSDARKAVQLAPGDALALMVRARAAHATGAVEAALADHAEAIRKAPRDARVHAGRGETLYLLGQLNRALADFDRACELAPEGADHLALRGDVRRRLGDLDGARRDLDRAIRLDPRNARVWSARGALRRAQKDLAGALADQTRAVELTRSWQAYSNRSNTRREAGDLDGSLADLNRALALQPRQAALYYNRSLVYKAMGHKRRTVLDLDAAIRLDPQLVDALDDRANQYQIAGHLKRALEDYSRALALDPKRASTLYNRALAYHQRGQLARARADLDACIALEPDKAEAWDERASVRRAAGDRAGAIADYTRSVRLRPTHSGAHSNLGVALLEAGRIDAARAAFEQAIALLPGGATARVHLALLHQHTGDLAAARATLDAALKADPQSLRALGLRGQIRARQGDPRGALDDFAAALRIDPSDVRVYRARSQLHQQLRAPRAALADLDRAVELAPRDPQPLNTRAMLKRDLGDLLGARADYDRALEIDPRNAGSYSNRGLLRGRMGDLEGALADQRQAIELAPKMGAAWANYGLALEALDRLDEALTAFDRAAGLARPDVRARIEGWRRRVEARKRSK